MLFFNKIFVTLVLILSFGNVNSQTSSPFEPPEKELGVFVINQGPGLDTPCTYRSGGPLLVDIPIPAVVNPLRIDSNGYLINVSELIANNVIGPNAIIRFPVFDIDSSANLPDGEPEVDRLTFNGEFQKNLVGVDSTWTDDSIIVPIEKLRFNMPNQQNITNELRIDIDTANPVEELWCMSLDWVSIEFQLAAPYILAHGINADRTSWDESSAPGVLTTLNDFGVRYERFSAQENGRSITNAGILKDEIEGFLSELNAKKVHIIAHSKGGLDSQYLQHLEKDFTILTLSTLSTPHLGSTAGDATRIKLERADDLIETGDDPNGHVAEFLDSPNVGPQLPGVLDLTTYEANNAFSTGMRGNINRTFTIGADADLNNDNELNINEDDGLFPGIAHWWADESWLILRDFSSITVTSITEVPGIFWGTNTVLVYNSVLATTPQANDIVVSTNSANPSYGTSLLFSDDANHGTVKNANNIQRILNSTISITE